MITYFKILYIYTKCIYMTQVQDFFSNKLFINILHNKIQRNTFN